MCLTIKDCGGTWHGIRSKSLVYDKYLNIAKKDLVVYKRLESSYFTPYQGHRIDVGGDILTAPRFTFDFEYSNVYIYKGIHSHATLAGAIRVRGSSQIIVPSIIPAGTPYFVGDCGDLVSLVLIIPPKGSSIYSDKKAKKIYTV